MGVEELFNFLIVTGKITRDNIEAVAPPKKVEKAELSNKKVKLINETIKRVGISGTELVVYIYAMLSDDYYNFMHIVKELKYNDTFSKVIERNVGVRSTIIIDDPLEFGDIYIKRIDKNNLEVVNKDGVQLLKGGLLLIDTEKVYRDYDNKYLISINKNGDIFKIKRKKLLKSKVRSVQLKPYPFFKFRDF